MTPTWALLLAAMFVLSIARVARLLNVDKVLDPLRIWVADRMEAAQARAPETVGSDPASIEAARRAVRGVNRWESVEYLIGCPWCASMWAAGLTAWLPLWAGGVPPSWLWSRQAGWYLALYVAVTLATSHLVGLGARWANDEDVEVK